jgi:hypothetical protein
MYKKLLTVFIILSSFLILSACGGGSDSAPHGSTITIDPAEVTYTSLSGTTFVNYSVVVLNENGVPLDAVELTISGGFAEPRVPARYQFHRSWNHNDPVISSFSARTDAEGVYKFSIEIYAIVNGVASEFVDFISVRSATVTNSVSVTVGETA